MTTAHDYYEKARQIFAGEALSEPPFAFYQDMYSQALRENDLDLALNLQQDLWNLLQKSICPPPATRLNNLLRLAALYWTEADYQNADRYLKEYLQLSVVVSARATHEQISVLSYLGLLAFRMNKLEEAESLYKQSLAFSETCPDISNTEQSELLSQLGLVLCSQDRNMEAQTGCLKAEELRGQPGNDPDDQFRSIASVYCARHCFSEAAKYCRSALDIIEMGCAAGKSETLAVILRRLGLADDAGAVATSETPRQTDSSTGA